MLRIRAFRAPDDVEAGERFAIGHRQVLEKIGVKVTSGKSDWVYDPFVYVMIVEDTSNNNKVVGGARLHIANRDSELPMVEAIGQVDGNIYSQIDDLVDGGVAEVCGLWNSHEIAGLGIGSNILVRICIALAKQANLSKLVALVAKHTLRKAIQKGFEVITTVGNEGKFNYPKLDLVATAIVLNDIDLLPKAIEYERIEILKLRERHYFVSTETWPKGQFELEYQLLLSSVQKIGK
ncbi:MAG: hypothetical protein ACI85Q_001273 [Salibacteraceae bacterium]|jgi:hypothetical protein